MSLWLPPPVDVSLSSDEVHVWRVALDQPEPQVHAFQRTLAEDELSRAARFYFPHLTRHFIVGRGVLRAILARYLGASPHTLRFGYTEYGKPFLVGQDQQWLSFNLSHSGGLALCAVVRERAIGVDIESIRRDMEHESIAERFFSPAEQRVLRALPSSLRPQAFFDCWTRKEAYIKAHGEGLSLPLDQFSVSLAPGEPAGLLHTDGDPSEATRWSLRELAPGPDYAAALAVEGHGWGLACWQWPQG
jgi:4'-phosphopantetheinyl transferase